MIKLAIFDFDDTLHRGQSHSDFFEFISHQYCPKWKLILFKIYRRAVVSTSWSDRKKKEFNLSLFKNRPRAQIQEWADRFYREHVIPRLHHAVVAKLVEHSTDGYQVVLASGGYGIYLRKFIEDYPVNLLVSTKLEFSNGVFTGRISGDECLGENKRESVLKAVAKLDIDWSNSFCYSDHHSDKYIFDLVGNKVVIDFGQDLNWVDESYTRIKLNQ